MSRTACARCPTAPEADEDALVFVLTIRVLLVSNLHPMKNGFRFFHFGLIRHRLVSLYFLVHLTGLLGRKPVRLAVDALTVDAFGNCPLHHTFASVRKSAAAHRIRHRAAFFDGGRLAASSRLNAFPHFKHIALESATATRTFVQAHDHFFSFRFPPWPLLRSDNFVVGDAHAALTEQLFERAFGGVTRHAAAVDVEPQLPSLRLKLRVVVVSLSGGPVDLLPSVDKFMQKGAEHFPELTPPGIAGIDRDLPLQPNPLCPLRKWPSTTWKPIDAQRHFRDFEFKLRNEPLRPGLQTGDGVLAGP